MYKKVLITGATGLIGQEICKKLTQRGDEVTIFTRSSQKAEKEMQVNVKIVEWDYRNPDGWEHHIQQQDAVIHLAGENLFANRWTDEVKKRILDTRRISTYNISQAIINSNPKPEVFVSASGIGIYGNTGRQEVTENTSLGNDFLANVCKIWESNAALVETSGVRRVSIRTGVALSTKEGALKQMLWPFKLFIGGPLGKGSQWFSWIHLSDLADAYIFAIDNKNLKGPVNASSPNPVIMDEFANTLGKVLKRPSFFKVPEFAIKLVAGEAGEVVTYSQKVIPEKLINTKFQFRHPNLKEALSDIIQKKD